MTYKEWRDELKNNLLSVSEVERKRVLDYYAEAYADRRDARYSERQIIEDFGAPYDAAQRILLNIYDHQDGEDDIKYEDGKVKKEKHKHSDYEKRSKEPEVVEAEVVKEPKTEKAPERKNYTWIFVLLCIVFAIPIFTVIITLVSISIGLTAAPFALIVTGIVSIVFGAIDCFSNLVNGLFTIGEGILELGIGLFLLPLLIKIIKVMWKLLKKLFNWLKGVFSGKEYAK